MTIWEYRTKGVLDYQINCHGKPQYAVDTGDLIALGTDGWELVQILDNGEAVFKRPV